MQKKTETKIKYYFEPKIRKILFSPFNLLIDLLKNTVCLQCQLCLQEELNLMLKVIGLLVTKI